ncbi:unnamed protein product [Arabis nemorensis]|uniref:Uncharacterized protein n=1 Tax=Arabis nemorensis TaxID=586526 RepID=A0A565CME9_9BRAS|nr:unnamed protein product [Arabis nemorensis]
MIIELKEEEEPAKRGKETNMQSLTSNEVAGFAVGALLLGATIAAPKVDAFIAAAQRRFGILESVSDHHHVMCFYKTNYCRSLGMCRKCGDLKSVACGRCKGTGSIKSGGIFGFNDSSSNAKSVACDNCQAKGCFPCPECSKS